ncbi:hypothetical protein J41TS2_46810 [Bacillus sonorensis]|nr:hypothetical protein J41TS2_46810 [Bacillus sonorensis]
MLEGIFSRIARYRNKIAHGDISESHKDIVFDLRVIELLYYVMVLDYIGVSKEKNLKALSSVGL